MDLGGLGSNTVKTPEAETETPRRLLHHAKPLSFSSNGVLKRHNPLHHHHRSVATHHHAVVVTYKECLKNHAASLGGHAVDGCGEFMPSPTASSANPTLLKCAACGCHRNFHRREPEETLPKALEYQSLHRHHPPLPPPNHGSPNSPSPPPISSSAPHMLLALSTAFSGPPTDNNTPISAPLTNNPSGRKRFRTKFTQDQKDKMLEFADKVGWKIQKRDEELINQFCIQIGVERVVLKVWMHNNKNTLCKRDQSQSNTTNHIDNVNGLDFHIASRNPDSITAAQFNLHQESNGNDSHNHKPLRNSEVVSADTIAVNGSSSSS